MTVVSVAAIGLIVASPETFGNGKPRFIDNLGQKR
jgi:hypothetical protein